MYRISISLGHVPPTWKTARVIFIPKPNKPDQSDPFSYRPIALSSFVLKTLDRLILWHLDDTVLNDHPLHPMQFGFQHNRGTDNAISALLDHVEINKNRRADTLAVFMDIKGAFDKSSFPSLTDGLSRHQFPLALIKWIANLLTTRQTHATNQYSGAQISFRHTMGSPSRGDLKPHALEHHF